MADKVTPVPLFTYQACENFFKNRKDDDFERIPLLALGCIFLLASKLESFSGFEWGSVVDFGKLGGKMSNLTDYWEIVDTVKSAGKATAALWPVFSKLDLTTNEGRLQAFEAAKDISLFAAKTISNFVNFVEMMVDIGGLKGLNIHKWKFFGSGLGALAYGKLLYTNLSTELKDPEDLKDVKKAAQDMYKAQHAWKEFYGTMITASILAMKVIGFCAAAHALYGTANVVKFIADRKGDLLLTSFATFIGGVLGTHFYGEQMRAFKVENKAT
ncbi:hypothetical protein [Simkania negevensis]|uniref:Uncharacterized protein n=1 Tax=Simkania negevensis (strain ATCC VR-1471 / DSM 27360 / Z) TaxID=331113 RepID=F8L3Y3_SIMNZ|nr:hypothetical protein [Simkania negevensis]CCB90013.1 unknown protein [Simkania negevensis Z]